MVERRLSEEKEKAKSKSEKVKSCKTAILSRSEVVDIYVNPNWLGYKDAGSFPYPFDCVKQRQL